MRKYLFPVWVIISCFITPCKAQGSDYIFKHLTIADGLISNKICNLFQDREGFMWIGTQTGVQRYDGKRFVNYVADIRDTAALQSDWISSIYEDSKNRLWFGSDPEGPCILNKATGKFYTYNLSAPVSNKIKGVWNITEDRQGVIWVAGHEGLYRLNDVTNRFENYNAKLGIQKPEITGWLTIDRNGDFWIGSTTGIKFYDNKEKKLYDHKNNPQHNPLFDINECIGVIAISGPDLWFTCSRKVYKYNFAEQKAEEFSFDKLSSQILNPQMYKEIIANIYCLQDGKVLVPLAGRGVAVYRPDIRKFSLIESDNSKPYAYHAVENSSANISIIQDRAGTVYLGSEKGINIYAPAKQYFDIHQRDERAGDYFPVNAAVSDFLELENGRLLISFYDVNGGIIKTDNAFHFQKQYLFNENGNKNAGANQIWNLFKDEQNMVWAPNQTNSILKLDPVTEKLENDTDSLLSGAINKIKQDSSHITWLGYWSRGLIKWDAVAGKMTKYKNFFRAEPGDIRRVQCLLPEKDIVWAGTIQNGLQVFDKKKEAFTTAYLADNKNPAAVSSNCITDIIAYHTDTLILATLMGVNIFDKKSKTFKAITVKEGLPNNLVQAVIEDGAGNIWIACYNEGLCKMNMHDLSITKYDINDGITDNAFTSKFYKLKSGIILLGASHSFISFDPSKMNVEPPPANVTITNLYIFEKELGLGLRADSNAPLELSYKENSIKIAFASFEYWNPGALKYFYKLEGADKDWVTADASNTAVYNQLEEGEYTFNVKCANREGIFCSKVTRFTFIIHPPFWKTWWFRLLVLLIIGILIAAFIKGREKSFKSIAAEKLKLQQLSAEQYKNKLKLEQIVNYFSTSLIDKNTVSAVLWDVAKNLIGQLGFVDCMIYTWNDDKTKMLQQAGFGPKDTEEEINKQLFTVLPGQGVVGYVMETKEPVVIGDTSLDKRYRPDDMVRSSEITVPVLYNNELLGIIDSEHAEKNFYTPQHLQLLITIAALVGSKIKAIEAEKHLQQKQLEIFSMNDELSKAKLEALRSQMNPHFIFNSLNAIQECILTNKVDAAYKYLSEFSKLQRMVLNNSEKELIPLSSETEMLQLYLSLESLRFSESFTYRIDTGGVADANEIMIPSLLVQPLVENAIWHGLRNKTGAKILEIIYEEKNNIIFISIDDNGIGRIKAGEIKNKKLGHEQFESRSTLILEQRLQVLGRRLKADIRLTITDKKDDSGNAAGTKAVISFPSNLHTL